MSKPNILITGSSGYVASCLIPILKRSYQVTGLDIVDGPLTDHVIDISNPSLKKVLAKFEKCGVSIVHLAALRTDFNQSINDYSSQNVGCTEKFLETIGTWKIDQFIHVSSVASFDGQKLKPEQLESSDDFYRYTKCEQERVIKDFFKDKGTHLSILFPSAIFDDQGRLDTNIGKLQIISRLMGFFPNIDVEKTLTYLPHFSDFILRILDRRIVSGEYLTVESPILTVNQIYTNLRSGRRTILLNIQPFITAMVYPFSLLSSFFNVDFLLTKNRLKKIYSRTVYDEGTDSETYTNQGYIELHYVLSKKN